MSTELLERAPISKGWDARIAVAAVLAVVFLCGAAAGALAVNSRAHLRMHQPDFNTTTGRALSFDRLQRELQLTPPQAEQVSSILSDMWQYYRTVLTDSKSRVEQVLTKQQREKFEQLLREQR
jgi:hypothetical protein